MSQTLETIDEMAGENTVGTSKNPSGIATGKRNSQDSNTLNIQNDERPYAEEESSMAVINLAQNSGQK